MLKTESFVNRILKPATVAAITTVCPLAGGVYQFMSAIETENLSKLVNDINYRVTKLEDSDRETFIRNGSSEDGESLLKYSFIKAGRCHKKEQIDKFVDIIMAALAKDVINNDDAEVLIDIVSDMNATEGRIFREIYDTIKQCYERMPVLPENVYLWEIERDASWAVEYGGLFDRFIAKGLLCEEIYSTSMTLKGEMRDNKIRYKYTYYGRLFLIIIYGFTETEFTSRHP